jgi:hypothetical protein
LNQKIEKKEGCGPAAAATAIIKKTTTISTPLVVLLPVIIRVSRYWKNRLQ